MICFHIEATKLVIAGEEGNFIIKPGKGAAGKRKRNAPALVIDQQSKKYKADFNQMWL